MRRVPSKRRLRGCPASRSLGRRHDLTTNRKRHLPYGEDRSATQPTFFGTRGFVGGTQDDTGLTHLGAREYDPTLGRFISVDPIQDLTDPQQWNGYHYANNNPTTFSDPSGKIWTDFLVGTDPHFNGEGAGELSYGPYGTSKARKTNHCAKGSPYACQAAAEQKAYAASAKFKIKKKQEPGFVGQLLTDITCSLMVICRVADTGYGIASLAAAAYRGDFKTAGAEALGFLPGCTRKCGDYAADTYEWLRGKRGKSGAEACLVPAGNSFARGTEVVMADGTTKPIEHIKTGDWVLATDPTTDETRPRQVTATHINHDTELADITVDLPDGATAVINTTQHHLFWSETRNTWIDGGDLAVGEDLLSLHNATVPVGAVHAYDGAATMYDLTVDQTHTYYVMAGDTPVLVHNTNCPIGSVTGPGGEVLPLPRGAAGTPVATGKGWTYDIPVGTPGLDPRVVQVRVMDPVTTGKHQYVNGYVVYMNKAGQSVNPITGQTVSKADPYNHIPIP
ncbi:polymorphic toxin-type HINT domain-containing protein [Micromonospora sp. NPDC049374]|uniref:polymorphic toxin-type HINT domain-containing protein n=1 Tax=Micromonospora sp. NPDC049374 TaxID=3154352 RepID=UPI00344746BC